MRFESGILFLLLLGATDAKTIVAETNQDHLLLAECALLVSRRFISAQTNTLIIHEKCNSCSKKRSNFNNRLIDHFLRHLEELLGLQLFMGNTNNILISWNYNIFVVDNVAAFSNLALQIPDTTYERELYFIIVLTHKIQKISHRRHIMRQIFTMCAALRVPYLVIMQEEPENDNSVGFYSFYMAGKYCSDYLKVKQVNSYRNGTMEHDYLFPRHPYDFHGCVINVSANILHPLLEFEGNHDEPNDLTNVNNLSGIEGYLLRILAESLNFKTRLYFPETRSSHGSDPTGCLSRLDDGSADIAIGGFSGSIPYRLKYSVSETYYQSSYVFVLRSGLSFGPLQQLANPFRPSTWIILGITCLLTFVFFKYLDAYDSSDARLRNFVLGSNNTHPINNMLTVLLGNPISHLPRRNFARVLLMCWLLATLILRNAYQGKLFDSLRVYRRQPIPKTITELIANNYKLLSTHFSEFYPRNMTIIVRNDMESHNTIDASTDRFVAITILDTLIHYNQQHWNSQLTYVEEPLFMMQMNMYFQKHSLLKRGFDEKLKQLTGAGITSYLSNLYAPPQLLTLNRRPRLLPLISNNMLMGLYRLHAALLGVALFCFASEVLSCRCKILRKFFG